MFLLTLQGEMAYFRMKEKGLWVLHHLRVLNVGKYGRQVTSDHTASPHPLPHSVIHGMFLELISKGSPSNSALRRQRRLHGGGDI